MDRIFQDNPVKKVPAKVFPSMGSRTPYSLTFHGFQMPFVGNASNKKKNSCKKNQAEQSGIPSRGEQIICIAYHGFVQADKPDRWKDIEEYAVVSSELIEAGKREYFTTEGLCQDEKNQDDIYDQEQPPDIDGDFCEQSVSQKSHQKTDDKNSGEEHKKTGGQYRCHVGRAVAETMEYAVGVPAG